MKYKKKFKNVKGAVMRKLENRCNSSRAAQWSELNISSFFPHHKMKKLPLEKTDIQKSSPNNTVSLITQTKGFACTPQLPQLLDQFWYN